ncbi:MAG TPA: hypothetical protein VNA14_11555 [Mycobacteriales bacterium]|nr:hypothetical protein [Mycobacteriales bacterium]
MDDVLVALVSCGGLVGTEDLRAAATAWAAARGHALDFDAAVAALDGPSCRAVPHGSTVLREPVDAAAAEEGLAADPAALRVLVANGVHFDQAAWAARFPAVRDEAFAAARRTYDTRGVRWRHRPANARKGAPPYLPPQRDPMGRLALVASLLDRGDAEATAWVTGLVPRSRQEWVDADRAAVVAALPAVADLLPEGVPALVAQALAGDERHGFGWSALAVLRAEHPGVFPDDVWADVTKRFARWAKRRGAYPMNDTDRAEFTETAERLGLAGEF